MASVHADDGSHWDTLRVALNVDQVNHSQRYFDKGVCTNQAESFFSRVDRMEMGTHHHIAGPYLWGHGCDAVWREDHRRETQAEKFDDLLGALLNNTVSRTMKGYWQRHLEGIEADPSPLDRLGAVVDDDDAIAVAGEIVADEGSDDPRGRGDSVRRGICRADCRAGGKDELAQVEGAQAICAAEAGRAAGAFVGVEEADWVAVVHAIVANSDIGCRSW